MVKVVNSWCPKPRSPTCLVAVHARALTLAAFACVHLCVRLSVCVCGGSRWVQIPGATKHKSLLDSHLHYKYERFHVDQQVKRLA